MIAVFALLLGALLLFIYGFLAPRVVVGVLLALRILTDGVTARLELTALSAGLSLALLVVLVLRQVREHDSIRMLPRTWWPLALVLMVGAAVSWHFGRLDFVVAQEVILWVIVGGFAILGSRCTYHGALKIATAAVVPAALLIILPGHTFLESTFEGRESGTFSHPNSAVVVFSLLTLAWFNELLSRRTPVSLALFGLFLLAGVSTQSLGGLAGLAAGIAYISFRHHGFRAGIAVVTVSAMVIVFGSRWFPDVVGRLDDLRSTTSLNYAMAGTTSNSLDWRFYNWSLYFKYIHESPIFGNGLGSTLQDIQPTGTLVHNDPLRILVELGFFGLLVAAALLGRLWRALRAQRGARADPSIAARGILLALAVHCLGANVLETWIALFISALLIGAALADARRRSLGQDHPSSVRPRSGHLGRREYVHSGHAQPLG